MLNSAPEYAKVWIAPEFPNMELLSAAYQRHAFARHTHEYFVIGTVVQGVEATVWRDQMVYSPPGDISFTNPDEIHTGHAATEQGYIYRALYPTMEMLSEMVGLDTTAAVFFKTPCVRDELLAAQMLRLHQTLEQPASSLEREEGLRGFLSVLFNRYGDVSLNLSVHNEASSLHTVKDFLLENFQHNVRLEQLAELVEFSPTYLLRSFKKTFGFSPHQYQTQLRVGQAKQLLHSGSSAAQAALEVGFYDQSHLNRHFKAVVGVTAGQYQQAVSNRVIY